MDNIKLKAGDVFLTENAMILGTLIRAVERMQSTDRQATYSHAGIILIDGGTTLESLWTVKRQQFFEANRGLNTLVVRYKNMNQTKFIRGYKKVMKYEGNIYPVHRLFFHMFNLSDHIHQNRVVCSELAARFLHEACKYDAIFDFESQFGFNPDNLHDIFKNSPHFDTIFEGIV